MGKIAREDRGLVESLVAELLPVIASQYGNGIKTDVKAITDVLLEYSLSISSAVPSREMACAEFAWRNGAFLQAQGITPLHAAWLEKAGINVDEQIKRMMTST